MSKEQISEEEKNRRAQAALVSRQMKDARLVASHSQSMAKHALIVQAMASNITTLFATFNAGLFVAFATYLSTPLGQKAVEDDSDKCWYTMACFTLGFLISCGIMLSVLHYSRNKFQYYRDSLTDRNAKDSETYAGVAAVLFLAMVTFTLIGVGKSVGIILSTHAATISEKQKAG